MSKAKKKVVFLSTILTLALIIGLYLGWYYWMQPTRTGEFTIADYTYYLEEFPSDKVVGAIKDARDAKEKGIAVLTDVYGKDVMVKEKPFVVYYDEQTDSWLISGSMPPIPFMHGGVGKVIIDSSNGDVKAIWHEK